MKSVVFKCIGFLINMLSFFAPKYAAKIALKLFSKPLKGKLTEAQIPLVQSAFFEELTYNNDSVAVYRWIGKRQTILLLHGWESNASRWHYLTVLLKEQGHTVVALDAPAHGESGSKEFNAILYAEYINLVTSKYQPDIVIGHSVGGMAAVFSEFKYPTPSINKMILLGSPAHFEGVFDRYVKLMYYNKRVQNGMSQIIIDRYSQPKSYFSTATFSKHIDKEVLLVHDSKDEVIPYSDAVLLKNSFPNARLYTTHGLGHSLKQDEVTQEILQFITS